MLLLATALGSLFFNIPTHHILATFIIITLLFFFRSARATFCKTSIDFPRVEAGLTVGLITISYFHRESYDSFLLVVKVLVNRNVPRVLIDHELLWFVSEGEPLVDVQGLREKQTEIRVQHL